MPKLYRVVAASLAVVLAVLMTTGAAVAATQPAPTGKLNLNAASAQQLEELPGVGPKLAARIVEYRQKSGGFKSVQELMNVNGIGEKNFEKIQGFLSLGEASPKANATK